MKLKVDLKKGTLEVSGRRYPVSCLVRTLRDGTRRKDEVIRSIPDNEPYDPRPFPAGEWNVIGVEWQKDKGFDRRVYGPVKIRTDARQWVKAWKLDDDGDYERERGDEVLDAGYLLHYSESRTTLGCIRIGSAQDAGEIGGIIEAALSGGEAVTLSNER